MMDLNQVIRAYKKGQHIIQEGDPAYGLHFVKRGKVKVISTCLNGKEQIVRLASTGHVLGTRFGANEVQPSSAIALDYTQVCYFDHEMLRVAFKANFEFMDAVMSYYSRELEESELRTKYFAQMTVEEKVTFALVYITDTFGLERGRDSIKIDLSRQEIAEIAGTNADQVSRSLASLKRLGYISTERKKILIEDFEGMKRSLSKYSNERVEYRVNLPFEKSLSSQALDLKLKLEKRKNPMLGNPEGNQTRDSVHSPRESQVRAG